MVPQARKAGYTRITFLVNVWVSHLTSFLTSCLTADLAVDGDGALPGLLADEEEAEDLPEHEPGGTGQNRGNAI